jgi:hypothetical protein
MSDMKILKFHRTLVPLILSGEKNSTWRLFDDKNLSAGDVILLQESGRDHLFAKARIVEIVEKSFKELTPRDKAGHESFNSDEEMYETYSVYYATEVGPDTTVKIIRYYLLWSAGASRSM